MSSLNWRTWISFYSSKPSHIVGADKTVKLADHDFRKVSIIPDAVLIHYKPQFQGMFQLCSIII